MEKKFLTIRSGEVATLTFEEVLLKYDNLINKRASEWSATYEIDEMKQMASIALWKAFKRYDSDMPIAFGYYADTVIKNDLRRYHRDHNQRLQKDCSAIKGFISLEAPIGEDNATLYDIILSEIDFTENLIRSETIANALDHIKAIPLKERRIFFMHLNGMRQTAIGRKIGISQAHVNRIIKKNSERLKQLHKRNLRIVS